MYHIYEKWFLPEPSCTPKEELSNCCLNPSHSKEKSRDLTPQSKLSGFIVYPTRKPNGLAAPNKKSNLESIPPYLLYQVQQNFKDDLVL